MTRFERPLVEAAGGEWSEADDINSVLDVLAASKMARVEVTGDYLRSKLAWKAVQLRQGLLHRLTDLADATISEWNAGNYLAAVVLARAFLETVALTHSIRQRLRAAVLIKSLKSIDEILMRSIFGAKSPQWREAAPEALNVQTAIDHLDKVLTGARRFYDSLSEIAHPNAQGQHQFYSHTDYETGTVTFSRDKREGTSTYLLIIAAIGGVAWCARALDDLKAMETEIADIHDPDGA